MNKKIIIIPIIVIVIISLASISLSNDVTNNNTIETDQVFHVTLALPKQYEDGVYTEKFTIEKGDYSFRFVPNGSSPETLSIFLKGIDFEFSEDFILEGTLHQTGISEYYTWKYNGKTNISISETQEVDIEINPNGNVLGSVSVYIIEN